MVDHKFTKQALKQLKKIHSSDKHTAKRVKSTLLLLRAGDIQGQSLQGYPDFYKIRIGKYRLIHTLVDGVRIIAIIEKRETVYQTFKHLVEKSNFLNV